MARPKKNNADYFTHDADMRNDVKVKALRRKFGTAGYAAWNYLLEVMTDSDYFEIDWSELNQELLSADFDLPVEELREIVDYCIRLGLLKLDDEKIFSEALHRRFSGLLSKRKRQSERNIDGENGNQKELSPAETPQKRVIDDENPQSKVKESKVKESKKNNTTPCNPPEGEESSEEKDMSEKSEKPTTSPTGTTGSAGNTPPGSAAPPSNIAIAGNILAKWRDRYNIPMLGSDWGDLVAKWLKYRAEIRKPYQGRDSIKRWLNQLYRLSDQDIAIATAIVNQSMDNEWEGIFELKTKKHNGTQFRQDSCGVRLPAVGEGEKFKDTI